MASELRSLRYEPPMANRLSPHFLADEHDIYDYILGGFDVDPIMSLSEALRLVWMSIVRPVVERLEEVGLQPGSRIWW